jgi:hypothetical protein
MLTILLLSRSIKENYQWVVQTGYSCIISKAHTRGVDTRLKPVPFRQTDRGSRFVQCQIKEMLYITAILNSKSHQHSYKEKILIRCSPYGDSYKRNA